MSIRRSIRAAMVVVGVSLALPAVAQQKITPPKKPADIRISVSPTAVRPGGEAEVALQLEPIKGVKINRYPKIKLSVGEQAGLVAAAETSLGSGSPPPPDKMKTNYFEDVEPLTLTLSFEDAAKAGRHDLEAKLTYFYCMPASGFCAPHRTRVTIPVVVE